MAWRGTADIHSVNRIGKTMTSLTTLKKRAERIGLVIWSSRGRYAVIARDTNISVHAHAAGTGHPCCLDLEEVETLLAELE